MKKYFQERWTKKQFMGKNSQNASLKHRAEIVLVLTVWLEPEVEEVADVVNEVLVRLVLPVTSPMGWNKHENKLPSRFVC